GPFATMPGDGVRKPCSADDVEDRRGGGDGLIGVALVVQQHAYADASGSPRVRGALYPEGADLAARHEHDMPAEDLQLFGPGDFGGEVDRCRLEDDVLGPDVQRGVR